MENTRVSKRPTLKGESPRSATSPSHASKPVPLAAPADPGQGADMNVDLRTLPIFPPERKNTTGMPDTLKTGVETLSGFSLDKVRVHYHSSHPARVRARAYTQGTDIHIGPGQEKYLPHEAWHVVQQMQGRVKPTTRTGATALNDDEALEQEADREGQRASSLSSLIVPPLRPSSEPETLPRLNQQTPEPSSAVQVPAQPVLQRMPFERIQAGRYYRVKIGARQRILYLKEKRSARLSGTGRAAFYFSYGEYSKDLAYIIEDEANILKEVAKPKTEEVSETENEESGNLSEETGEASEFSESSESESSESESSESEEDPEVNPRVLGVASWNVAHFSNQDIKETLKQLQDQLDTFSSVGKTWKLLFPAFKALLQAIKDDPLVEKSMKPPEKSYIDEPSSEDEAQPRKRKARDDENGDDEYREQPSKKKPRVSSDDEEVGASKKRKTSGKDKSAKEPPKKRQKRSSTRVSKAPERFSVSTKTSIEGVQDAQGHLKKLTNLITSYETEPEQFDINAFVDWMNKLSSFDWKKEYKKADSPEKRVLFAQKVKELRKIVADITKAKKAYANLLKLQEEEKLLSQLGKKVQKRLQPFLLDLAKVQNTLPKKKTFDNAARALHSPNIVKHIDEMFKKNKSWLDIMLLQEVNNPELLEKGKHRYAVRRGPHLMSGGDKPQNEYYPLLIRKGSGISVRAVYVVETNGKMKRVEHNQEYKWNKNPAKGEKATYRPIVVYDIVKENKEGLQRYWVGIVHTTPESDSSGVAEFNRRAIYKEIERGLKTLKEKAAEQKIPLIIGGDYYLSAEAVVKDLTEEQQEHSQKKGSEVKKDYDKSKEAVKKAIAKIDRELTGSGEAESGLEVSGKEQSAEKKKEKPSSKKTKGRKGRPKGLIRDNLTLASEKPVEEEETDPKRILLKKIRLVLNEASKDEQILRTIYKLTVAKQIKKLGLYLAQTVSGTNPKKDPLENWYYLQIADFFVHNEQLQSFTTGIMHPEGGILSVDTEDPEAPKNPEKDLRYSKYWQNFSDHFPVGAIYSLDKGDLSSHPAMIGSSSQKAKDLAKTSNINRFARLHLKQNDLTGVSDKDREKAALAYLKGWLPESETMDIEAETAEKEPETVEGHIKKIQAHEEERNIPPAKRLFVTLPGDFEPDLGTDDQSSSQHSQKPSPGGPGSKGGEDKQGKGPSGNQPKDPAGAQGKGPGSTSHQGSGSTTQQGSGATGEKSQKKDSGSMGGEGESKGAENAPQGSGSQTGQRAIQAGDLVLLEHVRREWTVVRVTGVKPDGKADVEVPNPAIRSTLSWSDIPVSQLPPAPADKQLGDKFPKQ